IISVSSPTDREASSSRASRRTRVGSPSTFNTPTVASMVICLSAYPDRTEAARGRRDGNREAGHPWWMKRLVLMRHAKSSWSDPTLEDHARPLNKRGKRDAPWAAERLVSLGFAPDVVLSSDSRRTRQTWKRMAPILPPADVTFTHALYHAGTDAVEATLGELGADVG